MKLFLAVMLTIFSSFSGFAITHGNSFQRVDRCIAKPIERLELGLQAGELLYNVSADSQDSQATRLRTIFGSFTPSIADVYFGRISPNGLYFVAPYRGEVVVFDRSGQLIYRGASSGGSGTINWLGNDRILRLNYTFTGRDSRLRSYFRLSYYIIDPFARSYIVYQPPYDEYERPFFYAGDRPLELYHLGNTLTYDGRYMLTIGRGAFDFHTQQVIDLENAQIGVPSMTSHRFLVVDYNSFDHIEPTEEQVHPIQIYDIDTDTLQQIATVTTERLMDVYENSWSPDEERWAYGLNFGDEIVFRPISIFDLSTGESTLTCLGRYYHTDSVVINGTYYGRGAQSPDFAWSRDSRYLALQGVLEGEDPDESLGVYIYDTQTSDIYEVYRGRADIIGWMAHPDS